MSKLLDYAKNELDILECDDPELLEEVKSQVLELLQLYESQDHSRVSGFNVMDFVYRLVHQKPITPLTGADDEWEMDEIGYYVNKRFSSLIKRVYSDKRIKLSNIDGIMITKNNTMYQYASLLLNDEEKIITFPYIPATFTSLLAIENEDGSLMEFRDKDLIDNILFEKMSKIIRKDIS